MVKQVFEPKQSGFRGHSLILFAVLPLLNGGTHLNKGEERKIGVLPIHSICIELVFLISVSYKKTKLETIAQQVQIINLAHRNFSDSHH